MEEGQIAENLIMVGFSTIIPSPLKREQIAESPIIVGFSTIIPSPRGRGLGRGQNVKLKKRRLKKMATKKYALPKPPKEKHKKQLLPKYVSDDLFPLKSGTRRLKSDFPDTSN